MGVCSPDMNSCTPKCKVCTGPNAGRAYDCLDPCGCYISNNIQAYTWNGYDCVKTNPCAPYGGSNCSGTIGYYFGVKIKTTNTGPAVTDEPRISDSTPQAYSLIGTKNGPPYSSLYYTRSVTGINDPNYVAGYGWVWNLPTRSPSWVYGGKSHQLNYFSGTSQIGVQFFLSYANGGNSGVNTFGFQGVGNPQCLCTYDSNSGIYHCCCGCQPCSIYWGCPGFSYEPPTPADPGTLYGKVLVEMDDLVVLTRWVSGPNEPTSYWTRIGG